MGAGGHAHLGVTCLDGVLKFFDEVGFQDVFDQVGISIHVTGSDVSVQDQERFPQPMIACDHAGESRPVVCQVPLPRHCVQQPGVMGSPHQTLQPCQ